MRNSLRAILAGALLAFTFPLAARAQRDDDLTPKARARAEVESRHEREHAHDKIKTIGGGTVVGAVAGAAVGGPVGAVAGAKLGHSGGGLFHGYKERKEVKKQMAIDPARNAERARRARLHRRSTVPAHPTKSR